MGGAALQGNILELIKTTIRSNTSQNLNNPEGLKILDNFKDNPELFSELLTVSPNTNI